MKTTRAHKLLRALFGAALSGLLLGFGAIVGLPLWVMLLGWTATLMQTPSVRTWTLKTLHYAVGLGLAMAGTAGFSAIETIAGEATLGLVLAIALVPILFIQQVRWGQPTAALLGFAGFFASYLSPGWAAALELGVPALYGAFVSGGAVAISSWLAARIFAGERGVGRSSPRRGSLRSAAGALASDLPTKPHSWPAITR